MSKSKNVAELEKNKPVIISGYKDDNIPVKFIEMGFVPGTELEVRHKAPFNGPISVCLSKNHSLLALRVDEAENILIEHL